MDNMSVDQLLDSNKRTAAKELHLIFKCERFEIEANLNCRRLDGKKILSDRYEEMYQTHEGIRVVAKKVGYNNGVLGYYPAKQDDKGKWVANVEQPTIPKEDVTKVIVDLQSGLTARKDTEKGIWFSKLVPNETTNNWLIEDIYNVWSEDNSDSCLKIYDYLMETRQVGVFRFSPYGTLYNAFLMPQRVNGGHFRLLLAVARVRIDKVEIAPTMVISSAHVRAKERERTDKIGVIAAIEEA